MMKIFINKLVIKNLTSLKTVLTMGLFIILLSSCSNNDVQTLNNKAQMLMNSGDVDGAISRLESINDLNPNFPQTYYNLGIAYHKKGDYDKSIAALNEAVRLKGDFADAFYTLGVVYEEKAFSIVDKNKKPDEKTVLSIYDNFKKSQESYKQFINLAKDSPDIQNVKNKVDSLDTDIKKYESMINNYQ